MSDWKLQLEITGPTGSKLKTYGYISEAAKNYVVKVLQDDFEYELKSTAETIATLTQERDEALMIHQTDTGTESAVAMLQAEVERLTDDKSTLTRCYNQIFEALSGEQENVAAANKRVAELKQDAARYRQVRRGQHWSVIDGSGNDLRAEQLDEAIDAAMR